jgi:tetratricopeptide (TPR) repeat protein
LADAVELIRTGSIEEALRGLIRLTAREPGFAEAHFQRGLALALAGRDAEAAGCYERALQLNPYHFAAAAALGHACVEQGDLRGAMRYYRQALQIHPRLEGVPQALQDLQTLLAARR